MRIFMAKKGRKHSEIKKNRVRQARVRDERVSRWYILPVCIARLDPHLLQCTSIKTCCFLSSSFSQTSTPHTHTPKQTPSIKTTTYPRTQRQDDEHPNMDEYQTFQCGSSIEPLAVRWDTTRQYHYSRLRDVQQVFPYAVRFKRRGITINYLEDEIGDL